MTAAMPIGWLAARYTRRGAVVIRRSEKGGLRLRFVHPQWPAAVSDARERAK